MIHLYEQIDPVTRDKRVKRYRLKDGLWKSMTLKFHNKLIGLHGFFPSFRGALKYSTCFNVTDSR